MLSLLHCVVRQWNPWSPIENQCHRKKCYNLISFCLGVSRVLKKSIDIFCCCGSWGAHTETCKSQIYHSVNVTFWIVYEIAAKVLCHHHGSPKNPFILVQGLLANQNLNRSDKQFWHSIFFSLCTLFNFQFSPSGCTFKVVQKKGCSGNDILNVSITHPTYCIFSNFWFYSKTRFSQSMSLCLDNFVQEKSDKPELKTRFSSLLNLFFWFCP